MLDRVINGQARVDGEVSFSILRDVLAESSTHGLHFRAPEIRSEAHGDLGESLVPPALKDYFVDEVTTTIIQNNLLWANGRAPAPRFQFAYFMLPTPCNQRCPACFMGQDKQKLPQQLVGDYFTVKELNETLQFLVEHGAKAAVYGGGGELFAWSGAFSFLERITEFGLTPVIFTNATLLGEQEVQRLVELGAVVIISLRDTYEHGHDQLVGNRGGFRSAISILNSLLEFEIQKDGRLAVEMPVTRQNSDRVLSELLPALRYLGVVPIIEEYIQITTTSAERSRCHTFQESRAFFERARAIDHHLGYSWALESGTRIIGQPTCRRSLYSFALFPSRDVLDCPSHSVRLGNLRQHPIQDILYSDRYRQHLRRFSLCPCSVFYSTDDADIPAHLPMYLEKLR